jgi:hypothetical protein
LQILPLKASEILKRLAEFTDKNHFNEAFLDEIESFPSISIRLHLNLICIFFFTGILIGSGR